MITIAFLTDFGDQDWYAAAMKGAVLSICPSCNIVDITHAIKPGNISAGAFILSQCWQDFPIGTVFLAVVDPGVGSDRLPVALEAEGRLFVGPDNGLFGWLGDQVTCCHRIANAYLFREVVTHTFHGRDIFGPVAARLAKGEIKVSEVGPEISGLVTVPWPEPIYDDDEAHGRILYIDHYGNAITNLRQDELKGRYKLANAVISLHPRRLSLLKAFSDAPQGQPLAYFGSGGLLEIAVNGGNAAQLLDLRLDQHVEVVL
ncbi:SAM hydrolase/SAM-dependent halogenase family protein [Cerasicoccus arenae]|uniref:SAM-dependent chlorinase/fluorinase n=1 Tax=Cerasicoccus arenae TaxID=424488 RepID=A0A8J3DK86_9BACT|nr:SAM-dependent chlorinase/fluorinase [Cerasicoccus arenae]MBK1857872.1 SAM-dependent chlorinase/fluorinase [Cerasicoccus arenae]GHC09376.1 hypothetical protein GCM10007047_28230 [Cerasicoccus arenae]